MKRINYQVALLFVIFFTFLSANQSSGQNIERVVQEIHNGKRVNANVTIYGMVTKWDLNPANNTIAYEIQDDWGDKVTVISATGQPETHKRYVISGYVAFDQAQSAYKIMETNRAPHGTGPGPDPGPGKGPVTDSGQGKGQVTPGEKTLGEKLVENQTLVVLILIVVVIALAVLIYSLLRSRSSAAQAGFGADAVVQVSDATQKITIALPKKEAIAQGTIKLMPGRFAVAGGVDIKEIRLIRPKTVAENEAQYTFGRKEGDPITHIRLNDDSVSEKQAILRFDNGQYVITNESKVNNTAVNDKMLPVYGSQALADGDVITMGRLALTYKAK